MLEIATLLAVALLIPLLLLSTEGFRRAAAGRRLERSLRETPSREGATTARRRPPSSVIARPSGAGARTNRAARAA
jgi:hypothetical protein